MFFSKKSEILLVAIGLIATIGVLSMDYFYYPFPDGLRVTADDPSYVQPALHFLDVGVWRDHSFGPSAYTQRPPLIGSIHFISAVLSRSHHGWVYLLITILFHCLSLISLKRLLHQWTNEKWSFWFAMAYALLPCYWGFLNYAISESLSISLCILLFALITRSTSSNWVKIIVVISCLWLLRPLLLLLFIPLIIRLLIQEWKHFNRPNPRVWLVGIGCGLVLFSWEYRKYTIMNEWLIVHPIYHASNGSQFRPPHQELSSLFRNWETRPEVFHAWMGKCWNGTPLSYQEVVNYCEERSIPLHPALLYRLLEEYRTANLDLIPIISTGKLLPLSKKERNSIQHTRNLSRSLSMYNSYNRWIKTPLIGLKEQLPKSQLNQPIFQEKWRGVFVIEVLRYLCVALFFSSLAGTIALTFLFKTDYRPMAIGILLYLIYLFAFQVMNEDRYLLPAWSLAYISIPIIAFQFHKKYQRTTINSVRRLS